ncbi:MAG: YdgA family protein, partial [Casimicrobium sp.]
QIPLLEALSGGEFTLVNVIEHGPFPGFSGVGAARITHTMTYPPEAQKFIKDLWGDKAPFTSVTHMGLGGGGTSTFSSPAFNTSFKEDGKDVAVTFKGLDGKVDFTRGYKSLDYNFTGAGVDLIGADKNTIKFGALSFIGKQNKLDGSETIYLGSQKFSVAGVEAVTEGKPFFTLQKVDYNVDMKSPEKNFIDMSAQVIAGGLKAVDSDFGNVEYALSAKRVHVPSLEKFTNAMKAQAVAVQAAVAPNAKPRDNFEATNEQFVKAAKETIPEFTKHNPSVVIDRIRVGTDKAFAQITGQVNSQPLVAQDLDNPKAVIAKLTAVANLEITDDFLATVKSMIWRQMQADPSFKDMPAEMKKDMEKQTSDGVDQQLAQVVQQGYLKREAGKHTMQFTLDKSKATLNGKPVPLPGL